MSAAQLWSYDPARGGRTAYGHRDVEQQAPVDVDHTMFIIASISKTFTATAVAQLKSQGRIDYDFGTDNQRGVIVTDKEYLLFFKRKVFEERALDSNAAALYDPAGAFGAGSESW